MGKKALININVPKVGRVKTRDFLYVAVVGAGLVAAWNWSSKIPVAGPHIVKVKEVVVKALGFKYPLADALI